MKMSTCSVVITLCRNLYFPKIGKFKKITTLTSEWALLFIISVQCFNQLFQV